LFQITLKRALGFCDSEDVFVVTSQKYQSHVMNQASMIGVNLKTNQVFLEPKRLNTLPAILAGVIASKASNKEEVLVLPSDHIISDEGALRDAVSKVKEATTRDIALFGLVPFEPHTGYGYIEPGEMLQSDVFQVRSFKEKPSQELARGYIQQGFLWNAGIFYFQAGIFLNAVQLHQPKLYQAFITSDDLPQAYRDYKEGVSIDYGLIEKIQTIVVSQVNTAWVDIGSFDALIQYLKVTKKNLQQIEGQGSVLISETKINAVTIGVDDLIIVQTSEGLLICSQGKSQLVKDISLK